MDKKEAAESLKIELNEKTEFYNKMKSVEVEIKASLDEAQHQLAMRSKLLKRYEQDILKLKLQKTG